MFVLWILHAGPGVCFECFKVCQPGISQHASKSAAHRVSSPVMVPQIFGELVILYSTVEFHLNQKFIFSWN